MVGAEQMTAPKLCVTCRWCDWRQATTTPECHAPQNREPAIPGSDLVTGTPLLLDEWRANYCSTHRQHGWLAARMMTRCGRRGRWWEPRPEQTTGAG